MQLGIKNGWTGGQYSLWRIFFGMYLAIHFAALVPYSREVFSNEGVLPNGHASPLIRLFPNIFLINDSATFVRVVLLVAITFALAFAVGARDRWAALGIAYVWASLYGRNPLIANPSLPTVGFILVAHSLLPDAPYGSWRARGRIDPRGAGGPSEAGGPGGGFRFRGDIFLAVWIVAALGYSYSGYTKLVSPSWADGTAIRHVLESPLARPTLVRRFMLGLPPFVLALATWGGLALELLYAPLSVFRRTRMMVWGAMTLMHLSLMCLVDFADLSIGMLFFQWFTFDPAWVKPKSLASGQRVFYDGTCGLCHRAVRFILAEDSSARFRFAPLGGDAFAQEVPEKSARGLPDSVVLLRPDGQILTRGDAFIAIGEELGGTWRVVSLLVRAVPRRLRDAVYDRIARSRKKWFRKPSDVCPVLPKELRARFDA